MGVGAPARALVRGGVPAVLEAGRWSVESRPYALPVSCTCIQLYDDVMSGAPKLGVR